MLIKLKYFLLLFVAAVIILALLGFYFGDTLFPINDDNYKKIPKGVVPCEDRVLEDDGKGVFCESDEYCSFIKLGEMYYCVGNTSI